MTQPAAVKHYLDRIRQNRATGRATEHTHRAALAELLESLREGVRAINEPTRIACGAPDLAVLRDGFMVGHVEAKDVTVSLDTAERSEQLKRYRRSLENLVLTNYLEFRWYVDGEPRRTVRLARLDARGEIKAEKNGEKNATDLLTDFLAHQPQPVGTPRELAERMARLTHLIREIIVTAFETEHASDLLTDWRKAFAEVLVADLDQPDHVGQFADMFAQTLAYGLFSARIRHGRGEFTRQKAQGLIPKTNPFLREFFSYITGVQLEDEPYAGLVEDLVQLLAMADMEAILEDFGRRTRQDDPTVHFYETFLAAYDPDLRERRGVFFTPNPIVSFIVRSVDLLLKDKFGLHDGIADTSLLPDGTHKVLILDPAVGTATFPYHVIDLIRNDFMEKGNAGMWSGYVREHLLPRIFGFELLMAPYAVAHFKLALQLGGHDLPEPLREQWAYDFAAYERLQIYLTNALEKRIEEPPRLIGPTKIVTQEAQAASTVKQERPIMVVVGNPPYSVSSSNKGDHIEELMNRYKEAVRDEHNIQPLSDDYIKFIRFAHDRVERTGYGVIGIITNHSYLSGLIHRGMREELLETFDEIYILNLHGNSLIGETTPEGGKDENVFDIRQGVAIALMVKSGNGEGLAAVHYADLWGRRESKYRLLSEDDVETLTWEQLKPVAPYYFFVPKDFDRLGEYEEFSIATQSFGLHQRGISTRRDYFMVDFEEDSLLHRLRVLRSNASDKQISDQFGLESTKYWDLGEARDLLRQMPGFADQVRAYAYRPFDDRYVIYIPELIERGDDAYGVMKHLLQPNLAFVSFRRIRTEVNTQALVTDKIVDKTILSARDNVSTFPLYLYPEEDPAKLFDDTATSPWEPDPAHGNRVPNLSQEFVEEFAAKLGLTFDPHKTGNTPGPTFGPEDILAYIYAVFHSSTYRERYAEFLKIDFPRVPLTSDVDLFWKLVGLGSELIALHLMEHPKLSETITSYPVPGNDRVKARGGFPKFVPAGESRTKTSEVAEQNRVYINLKQYFAGVPEDVWEFQVGGYQVLHKWLKDRKGRKLSYDELRHYQQIVVALRETLRLMQQLDAAIPSWPME
jgi:predicted helicase